MTRFPFGSEELGRTDPELDRVAAELEGYADETRAAPPDGLQGRILAAVDAEPESPPGAWSRFTAALVAFRRPVQALAAVAVLAAAVVGALAVAEIADRARTDGFGASPSTVPTPTVTVAPTPSPTPTPSVTASPTVSPTVTPTVSPTVVAETPEPAGDVETPEPSGSDDHGDDDHGESSSGSDH